MSNEPEFSESGAPIYRHQESQHDFEGVSANESRMVEIEAHVERYVGKPVSVFHELVSDLVHVDVHIVEPTPEHNFNTLFTTGMSDRPMTAPDDVSDCCYAEILICLPPDWKLNHKDFDDESNFWPLRWLKILARLPHQYKTWLFLGHTVPNGDPPRPFADNTDLCCALLAAPVLFGADFLTLDLDDRRIHFLALVPIYREEMEFKMRHGVDALEDRFADAGVTELLDVTRVNVCAEE
jgi:Suppressor of fused protein (SUFU)